MIPTPSGLRQFAVAERSLFVFGAKSLAAHLIERIDAKAAGKPWEGVVMRGDNAFAKLSEDPEKQLFILSHTTKMFLGEAASHNDLLRNAAIECVFAWLYHLVRKEIEQRIKTGTAYQQSVASKIYQSLEVMPELYESLVLTGKLDVFSSVEKWGEAVDKIAARYCWDNDTANKSLNAGMDSEIVPTKQLINYAKDYFQKLI